MFLSLSSFVVSLAGDVCLVVRVVIVVFETARWLVGGCVFTKRVFTCSSPDGVMEELERSLNDIETVRGAVGIVGSKHITSLHFLRNLSLIAPLNDSLISYR